MQTSLLTTMQRPKLVPFKQFIFFGGDLGTLLLVGGGGMITYTPIIAGMMMMVMICLDLMGG